MCYIMCTEKKIQNIASLRIIRRERYKMFEKCKIGEDIFCVFEDSLLKNFY